MNLLRNSLTITIAVLLSNFASHAQYGNEWIDFSQEYYKIQVAEEGIYRIDYNTLSNLGLILPAINPQNIQIFHNGEEQHIYVKGESDASFDPGDYIEFYGTFNDGSLDKPLYPKPSDQPHTYTSIYTDSAAYWLTWTTGSPGLRLQEFYDGNYSGKTADPYIWFKSLEYFFNEYYDGLPFFSPGYHSEYTTGEGWFSAYFSGSVVRRLTVPTSNYYSAGPRPYYEISVHAKSYPEALDANGFNHELEISVNGTIIYQQKYKGYKISIIKDSLDKALVGATGTRFDFRSILLERGRHAVSYMIVNYPRTLSMSNLGRFTWEYTGGNSYFEFKNYGSYNQPVIYDLSNRQRIRGDVSSGTLKFNTSGISARKLLIQDESLIKLIASTNIKKVNFTQVDPLNTDYDYLIITHPTLQSSAESYKAYRESAQGGSYKVYIAYSAELYDQYYYGIHHPMALRNFCRMMYENQTNPPEYLLLLGKGQICYYITKDPLRRNHEDLVPTWGAPPSDYMLVSDYTLDDLTPAMAVGRVPARKNSEVMNYLAKVMLHEQFGNTSKIFLQLTGGDGKDEFEYLDSNQTKFYKIARGEKLGMEQVVFQKDQSIGISESLVDEIQEVINNGVHTVSYFGHGASQVLEVDIGDPKRLNNKGKYPLFVFNGCALGHSFTEESLPEQFLLQPDDGTVSWIASSAFGFIEELYNWSSILYRNLYDDMYGEPIGKIIQATIDQYQKPWNAWNRAQARQMLYHGDPAIRFYAPGKPDYEIQNPISVFPDDVNAEFDSFALVLKVANYGLALSTDTPNIHIKVSYKNDSFDMFGPKDYRPVYSKDTFIFWIPMSKFSAGLNKFVIIIDSGDHIEELAPLGEFNNIKTFEYFMPSNSLFPVFPPLDGIISEPSVELVVQSYNLLSGPGEFIFEIDTTPEFNSPLLQSSGVIIGDNIIRQQFLLPPVDSTDFFWRARYNKPLDEGGAWEGSSFAYIYQSPNGWSQDYYSKYDASTKIKLSVDSSSRNLVFNKKISEKYELHAAGKNLGPTWRGINIGGFYYYPAFLGNGIGVIAVDPNTEDRWMDNSKFNKIVPAASWYPTLKYHVPGTKSGAYWFDMRKQEDRDSFVHYMNNIPEDYYIFLFLSGNSGNELWEDTVFRAFELFGASEINTVPNGHPYAIMGRKGWPIGTATEILANYNSIIPPEEQHVTFATPIYPLTGEGSMVSDRIGPSKSWALFYRTTAPGDAPFEELNFDVIGIKADNSTDTLLYRVDSSMIDLSFIDPLVYPYLKIKANFTDMEKFTPLQQKRWTVLYEGVPEGSLNPKISYSLNNDTLEEGDSLRLEIAFQNISEYDMDSVLVFAYNLDYFGNIDTIDFSYHPALLKDEHFILNYKVGTLGHPNSNRFNISVNHNMDQFELTLTNNVFSMRYHVNRDERNPLLDVTFDGIHILDKDIVSPSPLITMTVLDENNFIFINDPASFRVKLKHPDGTVEDITDALDEVTFIAAKAPGEKAVLEFHPKDLPSGMYELSVSVIDASGNESSELDYSIHFEVIRESTITNFYPYPNPFTTSMRFVYTLTGDQIPDYLKITIMTVSGKIVREITMDELGMMRIGNNVSEFAWDGTDEFGEPLANGVYIFKVTAQIDGQNIDHKASSGDQYFVDGYGKIYLMR